VKDRVSSSLAGVRSLARLLGIMLRTLAIPMSAVLAGCSTIPREMIGQFNAQRDFIVVESDGAVSWSPMSKTRDKLRFLGMGAVENPESHLLSIITPSTSQVWPKLQYSADYSRVTVTWSEVVLGAASGRSTEYERAGRK
jgi:hypothetical protein